MTSPAAFWQLGLTAALCVGSPGLARGQARSLVPFIGIGGAGALISYGSIQDVAQSRSNWGFGAEAGLSFRIGGRTWLRGTGGFARYGRAQVASCDNFVTNCTEPVTFSSEPGADLVTGSLDLLTAPVGSHSRLVLLAGGAVARQSGAYLLGDRTAVGVRAGIGLYPFDKGARGVGFEFVSTRYFTDLGGIRWAFGAALKLGL